MLAASLSHASVIQMGHSCLLSIAEPPFFDLKIEAGCGFGRKVPTPPIDVIARGQKVSCLDSLSVQSSWFLLSRYWFNFFISFFSVAVERMRIGCQCISENPMGFFSCFSKNTNEIVMIWQMLQYYKITKGKIFLQPSWLAKEVGKPTRCAASCQIARGELSLMHIYNTCIIQIIITYAIYANMT